MMRKLRWPLIAFAVACGAFYFATREDRPLEAVRSAIDADVPPIEAASQPMQVLRGGEMPVAGGSKPYFRVLEPNTGRVKYEFRADRWEPVGEQVFEMERPDIRIHTPGGQITFITAERGRLEVEGSDRRRLDPQRGWLRGNVHVIVDRSSRRWREAHPRQAARDDHPEQLVHIFLEDEARFDMERSRLTADGAIRVRSTEADVTANAGQESLEVRWNQIDNRLVFLALNHGGRMELRRGARLVDFAMPGTERDAPSSRPAQPRKRSAPPPAGTLFEAGATSASQPASSPASQPSSRPARRMDSYSAEFDGAVHVEQLAGTKVAGTLDCDRLTLSFDVGDDLKRRSGLGDDVSETPASAPNEVDDSAAASRPAASQPEAAPGDTGRLVLRWQGPMNLRPLEPEGAEPGGARFDAVATGRKVVVRDVRGMAECRRMEYRHEPGAVSFDGDEKGPARLASDDGREMTAPRIAINRSTGRAEMSGPGRMRDTGREGEWLGLAGATRGTAPKDPGFDRSADSFDIQWKQDVDISLAKLERTAIDPETGVLRTRVSERMRQARFRGDVKMQQGDRSLCGNEVLLHFGMPRRRGALADHVTRAELSGAVRLQEQEQTLTADALDVDLTITELGRNLPTRAVGRGSVLLRRPRQILRADRLDATFATATSTVDQTPRERAVLSSARAEGGVLVRDEDDPLEIDADRLDATFASAGQLATARLLGASEAMPAHARRGDYAVAGREVRVDVAAQTIIVPGAGHAGFVTDTDFDGRRLQRPVAVDIAFSDSMSLDGRANLAAFRGRIHAASQTQDLQCSRQLQMRFADLPAPAGVGAGSTAGGAAASPIGSVKISASAAPTTLVQWMRGRFISQRATEGIGPRVRKRPVQVLAEGDAVVLSSEYDEAGRLRSRMRVAGPALEADLRGERLNVPGRGSLAMEDYRARGGRGLSSRNAPRGGSNLLPGAPGVASPGGVGSEPSQTVFFWANAMSFDMREAMVRFDRAVQMIHRSGSQLVMQGDLAAAMGADVGSLRLSPGRVATLNCDDLTVQFMAQPRGAAGADDRQARAADIRFSELKRLQAVGHIYMTEGNRTLIGQELAMDLAANILTLRGAPGADAQVSDAAEATQSYKSWRGTMITWNRATGEVQALRPNVTSR